MLLLPEPQRLRRGLDAIAAEPALEPVDPPRRGARGAAQIAQQVRRPAGAQHRFQAARSASRRPRWSRPGSRPRARSRCRRTRGSRRSAGRAGPGRGRRSRSAPDRFRAASRRATSTAIASASPRSPAERRKTRLSSSGICAGGSIAPKPRSRPKRSGESVLPGSAGGLLDRVDPDLLERGEQRGVAALERRVALLEGQRHGHLRDRGEGADQVQLVAGQVVEAVEEDRSPPEPALGLAAGRSPRARCRGCRRFRARRAPPRSRRRGSRCRRGRRSPRGSPPPLRRPPAPARRPAARRAGARGPAGSPDAGRSHAADPSPLARSTTAAATAPRRCAGVRTAPGGAPPAVATVRKRPPKVITSGAEDRAARAELPLEGVDVVEGGDDEDRIAVEHGDQPMPDPACAARVRRSVDQLQRHAFTLCLPPARPGRKLRHRAPVLASTAPSKLHGRWLSAS